MSAPGADADPILLTGASGYVGGRLLESLLKAGRRVRCLTRNPERLRQRLAARGLEAAQVVQGDVLEPDTLAPALAGCRQAYYLVHSMEAAGDFEELDRTAARNFAAASARAGLSRIVYLGGLGGQREELSSHLASRQEVGALLAAGAVLVTEFRASIVLGSGSLSFEMVRALVERLPVMITPRWVSTLSQPIAVEDLIAFLAAAVDAPVEGSAVFEIGGATRVSYREIMREYARQRGLRRWMIPVPVLTPRLSSLWLGLVTPLYARVGRRLVDSLRNETIVTDERATDVFGVHPRGMAEAIARALVAEDEEFAATRWIDALPSHPADDPYGGVRFGTRLVDTREVELPLSPARAWEPVARIGGRTGWYACDWLWRARGFLDLLVGGVGLRRGRRDPRRAVPGDVIDFWRVERVTPGRLLRLRAEMKLPGRAWLQFEVEGQGDRSTLRQTALFDPRGLAGLLYWYGIWPLHRVVFRRMLAAIARAATHPPPPAG